MRFNKNEENGSVFGKITGKEEMDMDFSLEPIKSVDYKKVEKILSELVFISSLIDISDDDEDTMEVIERISKLTRKYKKEIK